eukprot:TRINITY_DN121_c0_g1_i9.p1 TRINITY_DN121_c0_g1~~TRINITY_DN121_c0_g1_i9.p1  ORF type:complete len:210 (+),score=12.83 TRINITY_DN121_c0_g1_i9:68-631(+)
MGAPKVLALLLTLAALVSLAAAAAVPAPGEDVYGVSAHHDAPGLVDLAARRESTCSRYFHCGTRKATGKSQSLVQVLLQDCPVVCPPRFRDVWLQPRPVPLQRCQMQGLEAVHVRQVLQRENDSPGLVRAPLDGRRRVGLGGCRLRSGGIPRTDQPLGAAGVPSVVLLAEGWRRGDAARVADGLRIA